MTKTRFILPRSHTSFKNYEIWNLAITSHPGSNKSGFVEFRGRMQNGQFHGPYKFHSDLSENSFGHNFCFPLWKFDFSDSLERYSLTDLNIFGFTKIRYILHSAHSVKVQCPRYVYSEFYIDYSFGHNFWFPLWNLDFSDSLERYF